MIGHSAIASSVSGLTRLQRVSLGHDHAVMPAVEREGGQRRRLPQRLGADADVGIAVAEHGGDLGRAALVQRQAHLGVGLAELGHHVRQHVARLRVRGGDDDLALLAIGELLAEPLDVGRVDQHALDDLHHLLAGVGEAEQPLAAAHEQLDAEFVLQVADVLADARLRGVQRVRHLGQVEVAPHGLADDAQLLEVHGSSPVRRRVRRCSIPHTSPNRMAAT